MVEEKVIVTKKELLKNKKGGKMDKLAKLIESERVLLSVKTVFPFTFFPDTVVVTEEKVSLVNEIFYFSKQIRSVLIKDIATVQVGTSLFFGKLEIIDKNFQARPIIVDYLKKDDALEARRVIQGLIVIAREEMDLQQTEISDLTKTVGELGSSKISEAENANISTQD